MFLNGDLLSIEGITHHEGSELEIKQDGEFNADFKSRAPAAGDMTVQYDSLHSFFHRWL